MLFLRSSQAVCTQLVLPGYLSASTDVGLDQYIFQSSQSEGKIELHCSHLISQISHKTNMAIWNNAMSFRIANNVCKTIMTNLIAGCSNVGVFMINFLGQNVREAGGSYHKVGMRGGGEKAWVVLLSTYFSLQALFCA